MELLETIKPTSKAALKQQCLMLAHLDVEKAERMYDFLVKDMGDLPALEPAARTFMQSFGEQANGVLGWVRENQDIIGKGVELIRGLAAARKGGGAPPAGPLPPING